MTRAPLSQLDDWVLEDKSQDLRGQTLMDASGDSIGTIEEMIVNTDTEYIDSVVLDTGAEIPVSDLNITDQGVYLIGTTRTEVVEPATDEYVASAGVVETEVVEERAPAQELPERGSDEAVVPIVEEELRVGKRPVERGGIRIHKRVEETPVSEQVTLRDETVDVERRPVDRPASEADVAAVREGAFEVHERDEEAVVDKEARVVEELVVNKDVEERTETVQDTVRRTDVDVDETRDERRGS